MKKIVSFIEYNFKESHTYEDRPMEIGKIIDELNCTFLYQVITEEALYRMSAFLIDRFRRLISVGLYKNDIIFNLIRMTVQDNTACPANVYLENLFLGNDESLEDLVNRYIKIWKNDTIFMSSSYDMMHCESFIKLTSLKHYLSPFIRKQIEIDPNNHWYLFLGTIEGWINIPECDRGDVKKLNKIYNARNYIQQRDNNG